ncbi:GNAT family N-acetyltransferase [Aliiglaciecola sp. CAU 1673]|uniref:GNAT family N-acetyltransferase n=1 Tax=Aliiglaciecola sp. CAU 1673 TaxID=3032595 RepID=UPI0023DAE0D2|nr:GNAT family N-acetyltransferase [Aliiglaciecola sp. CAU 1673]MDF2178014.1 GNAT family N-acetyltransferase [Aliiglaciecola sp. CAU 1673]
MIFETARLQCRMLDEEAIAPLQHLLGDPQVMQFSVRGVQTPEQVADYVQQHLLQHQQFGYAHWGLWIKERTEFAGVVGFNCHEIEGQEIRHITYRLLREKWGQGLAQEAVRGALGFAHHQLGWKEVSALVEPQNKASASVLLRCDFNFVRHSLFVGRVVELYHQAFQ